MEEASDSRITKIQIIDTSHNTRKTPENKNQIIAMYKLMANILKNFNLPITCSFKTLILETLVLNSLSASDKLPFLGFFNG